MKALTLSTYRLLKHLADGYTVRYKDHMATGRSLLVRGYAQEIDDPSDELPSYQYLSITPKGRDAVKWVLLDPDGKPVIDLSSHGISLLRSLPRPAVYTLYGEANGISHTSLQRLVRSGYAVVSQDGETVNRTEYGDGYLAYLDKWGSA